MAKQVIEISAGDIFRSIVLGSQPSSSDAMCMEIECLSPMATSYYRPASQDAIHMDIESPFSMDPSYYSPASSDSMSMDVESPLPVASSYYNDIADHSPIPYPRAPRYSPACRRLQFEHFEGPKSIPSQARPQNLSTVRSLKPSGDELDSRQRILKRKGESLEKRSPIVKEVVGCGSCCPLVPPPKKLQKKSSNAQQFMNYTCTSCSKTYANFYLETTADYKCPLH